MKDVEIVVFNDKSWVRFTEYQKLDEELKQEKQSLAKRIYELQSDLSREKSKNENLEQVNNQLEIDNYNHNANLQRVTDMLDEAIKTIKDLLWSEKHRCTGEEFSEIRDKAEIFVRYVENE